jgi:UDP-N-acetylmuramate dehydrogenase
MPVRRHQVPNALVRQLASLPNVTVLEGALLSQRTRFGIGGPADVYLETCLESSFTSALQLVRGSGVPYTIIGDGTNLIVSDAGYAGVVLRFTAARIEHQGSTLRVDAGAELQALVDYSISAGLRGLETMTGIPGSVGAAVYGNAGAYGHSIDERIRSVRFFDSSAVRVFSNTECAFRYRESIFKLRKDCIILSAELEMDQAPPGELQETASGILRIRLEKYPLSMKCAGSIFKNLIVAELPEPVRRQIPERVIREGKAPSAYFLEQVGAKGFQHGGIRVADYHANLIYNAAAGTARQLCEVITELKSRVQKQFGLTLEEEVQYVGFSPS